MRGTFIAVHRHTDWTEQLDTGWLHGASLRRIPAGEQKAIHGVGRSGGVRFGDKPLTNPNAPDARLQRQLENLFPIPDDGDGEPELTALVNSLRLRLALAARNAWSRTPQERGGNQRAASKKRQ